MPSPCPTFACPRVSSRLLAASLGDPRHRRGASPTSGRDRRHASTHAAVVPGDLYAALPGAHTHGARFAAEAGEPGSGRRAHGPPSGADRARPPGCPALVVADPRSVLGDLAAAGVRPSRTSGCSCSGSPGPTARRRRPSSPTPACGRPGTRDRAGRHRRDARRAARWCPACGRRPRRRTSRRCWRVMLERGCDAASMEVSQPRARARPGRRARRSTSPSSPTSARTTSTSTRHGGLLRGQGRAVHPRAGPGTASSTSTTSWGRLAGSDGDGPGDHGLAGSGADADWRAVDVELAADGSARSVAAGPTAREVAVTLPLPGRFNVANALLRRRALDAAGRARWTPPPRGRRARRGARADGARRLPASRSSRSSTTRTRPTRCRTLLEAVRTVTDRAGRRRPRVRRRPRPVQATAHGRGRRGRRRRRRPHRATTRGRRTPRDPRGHAGGA